MIARDLVAYLKHAFHRLDDFEHISGLKQSELIDVERWARSNGHLPYSKFIRRVRDLRLKGRLSFPKYVHEYYRPQLDGATRPDPVAIVLGGAR